MPRRKLDKIQSHWRIKRSTTEALSQIAKALGYEYGESGAAVGEMLDAIADGKILLVQKESESRY